MSDQIVDYTRGDARTASLLGRMRHSFMWRATCDDRGSWKVEGPPVFFVGENTANAALRRWALGFDRYFYVAISDGFGIELTTRCLDGHGNTVDLPADLAFEHGKAWGDSLFRSLLVKHIVVAAAQVAGNLSITRVNSEGIPCVG